ncbi:MAG: hypothetical protein N2049_00845 [Anaerolineales bacterium]|nr:hypothetical protein [Anaerolineales bacterium]MCX7607752.1 hypothetical protein [Anaerolineales bacterium]MDW8226325.1 hypothetical protein [Anaerolineales bacterium]
MLPDEKEFLDGIETGETQPPEEGGNRTFLIIGGIFAGVIFLTLACMAAYLLFFRNRGANIQATQAAQQTLVAANSQTQVAGQTLTAEAALWTNTPSPTPLPTNTPRPTLANTPTAVINFNTETPISNTGTPTNPADSATLLAMQTQLAGFMTQTAAYQLGTRAIGGEGPLPATGFADEVGLPLLILLTFALLAVIFIARRMRRSSVS